MSSGYKKLHKLIPVMGRKDFEFIADYNNLKEIEKILLERVSFSIGKEKEDIEFIEEYLENMDSFLSWLNPKGLEDIMKGYRKCKKNLQRVQKLLREPEERRKKVSGNYLRKFLKDFLYGVGLMNGGLMIAFNENFGSFTDLESDQLARFALNKKVGYGQTYLFNAANGKYNFAHHIFDNELEKEHLSTALKFLEESPPPRRSKGDGDFLYWGGGRDNIRIHFIKKILGKTRIYRIYRNNSKGHEQHEKDIAKSASDFEFKAA